jgi:hypothetical protein
MGLGKRVQPGDAIALITTCEIPFALRPVPGTSAYTLGQPAVLEDVMMGEQWPADNETGLEAIEIV